jgi:hypothetical protein
VFACCLARFACCLARFVADVDGKTELKYKIHTLAGKGGCVWTLIFSCLGCASCLGNCTFGSAAKLVFTRQQVLGNTPQNLS